MRRRIQRFAGVALTATLTLLGCGGSSTHGPTNAAPSSASGEGDVEERVTYERMPDGRVKKTTTRTTKRTVPAPPPPARAADPMPNDPVVKHNVDRVNAFRAQKGLAPLLYDAKISAFAHAGSERLARDHSPHAHFAANAQGAPGFGSRSAENQGDPSGVPSMAPDPITNGRKQVDVMLELMMAEGPGGGHHDNMMNPAYRRIGVGIVFSGGKMYMTNDFSD